MCEVKARLFMQGTSLTNHIFKGSLEDNVYIVENVIYLLIQALFILTITFLPRLPKRWIQL